MSNAKNLVQRAVAYVKDLYQREPTAVNTAVLSVLLAVGIPVTISGVAVAPVVAAVLLVLLGGAVTRSAVYSPATVKAVVRATKRKK